MRGPDTGNWGLSDNLVEVEIHFVQVVLAAASVAGAVVVVVVAVAVVVEAQVVGFEHLELHQPVP